MRKLTLDQNGKEVEQSPRAVFQRQITKSGKTRIVTYVPDGQSDLLRVLSKFLEFPLYILYVLHTPRGEGEPGRYQSMDLSEGGLQNILEKYTRLFSDDGRHDLWVYSPETGRTLVWDRHNILFAEGEPLDDVIGVLSERGFEEGMLQPLGDHFHNYRPEYDLDAASLLAEFDWHRTPLRAEDEQ